jgi:integrase
LDCPEKGIIASGRKALIVNTKELVMTLESPSGINRTVADSAPQKPRKSEPYAGQRQWLSPVEIERLMTTARKHSRWGSRDALMVLLGYVHGFRASELVRLQWSDIDWERGLIHCRRKKNGINTDHPLTGRELRGLRKLKASPNPPSRFVFISERGSPMTPNGFYKLMIRLGEKARIAATRPHRLRHSCGFKLANDGRDTRAIQFYLGHSDIRSTCRYTDVVASRFEGFFED